MKKKIVVWGFLFCWAVAITVPMSFLMANHLVSYDAPDKIVEAPDSHFVTDGWSLNHVLSGECKCSLGVAEYLVSRKALGEVRENIILMDGTEALKRSLQAAGYSVSSVDSEHVCEQYGSLAVPYFQLITPDHSLYFSSGYLSSSDRTQYDYSDVTSYRKAMKGESLKENPFFGCATSTALKEMLNPFKF